MSREESESDNSRQACDRARARLEAAQDDASRAEAAVDEALACARHELEQLRARQRPQSVRAAAVFVGALESAAAIAELCKLEGAEQIVAAWALLDVVDPAELRAFYESGALRDEAMIPKVIERLARGGRSEDVPAVLARMPQCDARTMRVMIELLPEEVWRPCVPRLREWLSVGRDALADRADDELDEEALRALNGAYVLALTEPTRAARIEALEVCDRTLERAGDRVTFDADFGGDDPRAEAALSWLWIGEVARAERWLRAIVAAPAPWSAQLTPATETVEELLRVWCALTEQLAPEQRFRWESEITAGLVARAPSWDGWCSVGAALERPSERRRSFEQAARALATDPPPRWNDPDATLDAMPRDLRAPLEARALDALEQHPESLAEDRLSALLRAISTDQPATVARCVAALRALQHNSQITVAARWLARAASAGTPEAVELWRTWTSRGNATWAYVERWYVHMPAALVRETIERIRSVTHELALASLCRSVGDWAEGESDEESESWWPELWDALATSPRARVAIAGLAPERLQPDATRWFVENVACVRHESIDWQLSQLPESMRSKVALAALRITDRAALTDGAGSSDIAWLVEAVADERASLDALRSIATTLDEVPRSCLPTGAFARWMLDEKTSVSSSLSEVDSLIKRLQRDATVRSCADTLLLRASAALASAPSTDRARAQTDSLALGALAAVASRDALLAAVSLWTDAMPTAQAWHEALVRGAELDGDARDAVLDAIDAREVRFERRWSVVLQRRLRGATASLGDEPLPFDVIWASDVQECARIGLASELLSAVAREERAIRVRLLPSLWRAIDAQTRERFTPMLLQTARQEFDENPGSAMLLNLAPWLPTELLARFAPVFMPDRRVTELLAGADGVRRVRVELETTLLALARNGFDITRSPSM